MAAAIPRLALNLLQVATRRAVEPEELAERIGHWPVPRRLAAVVAELDERYGHPTLDGGRIINSRITQATLAEMVCARRETVNEALRELREQGILASSGRRIVVRDRGRLLALLDGA